jgi:hypothetical protein
MTTRFPDEEVVKGFVSDFTLTRAYAKTGPNKRTTGSGIPFGI